MDIKAWDELRRLLTNRMNFEREECDRLNLQGLTRIALLNQATAFEFTLGLMARLEREHAEKAV